MPRYFGHRNIALAMVLFFLFSSHLCRAAEQKRPGRTTIDLHRPPAGKRLEIDALPKALYVTHFDISMLNFMRSKDDLALQFEDGAEIVLRSVFQKQDIDDIVFEVEGYYIFFKDFFPDLAPPTCCK